MLTDEEILDAIPTADFDERTKMLWFGRFIERAVLAKALAQQERLHKEWSELWSPIDEAVRPLTPLGESVAAKALELINAAKAMPIPKQEPDIEKLGDQLANAEIAIQSLLEQKPAYRMGYQYDEGNEDPDLGGELVLNQLDGKDYPVGTLFYAFPVPAQAAAIPEWLMEMSQQMRTQDNRGTSHPFFQVRCKRYIVTEQGYNEHHWEICGDDGVVYRSLDPIEILYEYLNENHSDFVNYWNKENHVDDLSGWFDPDEDEHFPDGLRRIYVQEVEEIVTTHLTEEAAYKFIARKQHDYPKLYTYAESAYWSPQLRQLQDWIISLSASTKPE